MMRAVSPPTHHPIPLPAPSTSRRADIPEADIPPRKRLLLTASTPRFEVGESSAAAARQSGSTVARKVNYSFVDIVDASIRASERRTLAAIEVVNLRVSYQADVHRRESEEFYTRHHDAQRDHDALRDEDGDDHTTRAIMRIHTLEAGARIDTLEDIGSSA
ncbi:hypothetical protein Tco_1539565 [Tanacetum coccineum]